METKTTSRYYGQFGTDRIIEEYCPNIQGTCIEIGAVDGVFISNSLHFEQIGWDALCIEPIPSYYTKLKHNRKNALNYAISSKNEDNVDFTVVTMSSQNQSSISGLEIDDRLIESHTKLGLNPQSETIKVNTRRLDWCIENHFKNKTIDFISIDTEGNELDVLHSFDVNAYNTTLLIIENNYNETDIEDYLKTKGWVKDKRVEVNDFYIKQTR